MFAWFLRGRCKNNVLKPVIPRNNVNVPCQFIKNWLHLAFYPDVQLIVTNRHIMQLKVSIGVDNCVDRCGQSDNDCTHLGMNVAEDIRQPFVREGNFLRTTCFIEPEVETFAVEERKNIMKKWVCVRKRDYATDG